MNFIEIIYQEKSWDSVIRFLQSHFKSNADAVELLDHPPENFMRFSWNGLIDPNELAAAMTLEIPDVVIECESNTGIDVRSRYFNKAQQW